MAFNEKLPKWDNVGVEPPESKKVEGWQPTEKPPAQWFNWIFNRIYKTLEEIRAKAVEKETGKGLSTNDYTTIEKNKLADIEDKANKTVIANNLTETVVGKALDATQGKILNDNLVAHKAENANKAHGGIKGALVRLSVSQSIPASSWTKVVFDTIAYNFSGVWNNDSKRMIVPSGATKVRLTLNVYWSGGTRPMTDLVISKNGTRSWPTRPYLSDASNQRGYNLVTPILDVIEGDYFELEVFHTASTAIDVQGESISRTFFAMEVVE